MSGKCQVNINLSLTLLDVKLVSVFTIESPSNLSCEPAPVLQLLIATAPIISPGHGVSIEMFFSKPSPCWHPDVAWLEPGQRSLLLSICSRGILFWYFELSRGVKTWNSTSSSSNQTLSAIYCYKRRDTTCFSIQSLLFYWDENIMFLLQDLWVTPCKWSLLLCSFAWESVLYINTAQLCMQSWI